MLRAILSRKAWHRVPSPSADPSIALKVEHLQRTYRSGGRTVHALDDVTFDVLEGTTLAVIGESGSGKSTLVRIIAGLEVPTGGVVEVHGLAPRLRPGRPGPAQLVFQDPAGSLNPHRRIWKSVAEPLRHVRRGDRKRHAREMLERVGIGPTRHDQRPGRFSGGQLQRVAIARTLVSGASVVLCDEPTSALDVSVQAQILNLLQDLQREISFTCVFVTHDLAVAQVVADRIMVLREGRVCELSDARVFFAGPRDSYGAMLLNATREQHGSWRLGTGRLGPERIENARRSDH
jgi:peptide/nickel transport system ATP-binding protein